MTIELDVRDLLRAPGSSRDVELREPVDGLATALVRVPDERPIAARLVVESLVQGVLVSGPLTGPMVLTCARCLRSSETEFRVEVQELFVPNPGVKDDEYPLVEGFLDLEPMIRDAVLLAMPFSPLCRPQCLGLCERCGGDRNLAECVCSREQGDARWAVLSNLDLWRGREVKPT